MKHPADCMDAVFDLDPEPGHPVVVPQAGPPPQESIPQDARGLDGSGITRSA